jgi:DNA-binding NarL/FixJ family response regulator
MKVLVVDDHPLIHTAMPLVLKQLDQDIEVFKAASFEEALPLLEQQQDINLILLDLSLPGISGFAALTQVRTLYPAIPVVVLSGHDDTKTVTTALEEGAMGFIPKSSPNEILVGALRLVLSGGVYLPREVLQRHSGGEPVAADTHALPTKTPAELGLTPRQTEVLSLLVQGKPNKIIMRELGLAEGTVKLHITNILRALNVDNRTQAVMAVARRGIKLEPLAKARPAQ